jgi:hypothetical protein
MANKRSKPRASASFPAPALHLVQIRAAASKTAHIHVAHRMLFARRMLKTLRLVPLLLVLAAGCSQTNPEDRKLAKLCVEATSQLQNSRSENPETFKLQLSNALEACSGGCDDGNKGACQSLDSHVAKICGVSAGVCESLCSSVKSPSLKKATCDFKKK